MAREEEVGATGAGPAAPAAPVRVVAASELLGTGRTLQIEHNGNVYTLRLTRNERLILTK